jgi:hypothetical protein
MSSPQLSPADSPLAKTFLSECISRLGQETVIKPTSSTAEK